jgi:hypothetical protein
LANIINGTDTGSGGLITTGDSSDELQLQTAEVARVTLTNTAVVVNESGADVDFRVEGDTDANLLFVDASTDRVGIGTSSPSVKFEINGRVLGESVVAGNALYVWSQNRMSLGASYGIESQQSSPFFLLTNSAQPIVFGTNNTERMRIDSSGYLRLAGGGIQFNGDTAAANALDDYEEGTWTPVIGGSGGESGQSYTNQIGLYTKVGKIVTASFLCILSAKGTITGDVRIKGLPFTADATANQRGAGTVGVFFNFATNINWIGLVTTENATAANVIYTAAAAANISDATTTQIGNSTRLDGTIVYIANA